MTTFTESIVEDAALALRQKAAIVTFGLPGKTTGITIGKTLGKTLGKTPGKTPEVILRLLAGEPDMSIPELAMRLGKSESAVERAIRKLRESGRLVRVGPDKGGRWEVQE